jgi:hypothetical protein
MSSCMKDWIRPKEVYVPFYPCRLDLHSSPVVRVTGKVYNAIWVPVSPSHVYSLSRVENIPRILKTGTSRPSSPNN